MKTSGGQARCRDCGVLLGKQPHELWCQSASATKTREREHKREVRIEAALEFTMGGAVYTCVDTGPLRTYAPMVIKTPPAKSSVAVRPVVKRKL